MDHEGQLNEIVVVKGGGDLASGAIYRLHRAGFQLVVTEIPQPTTLRRRVSFSEAVYSGAIEVDGVGARLVSRSADVLAAWQDGIIPVLVDPEARVVAELRPQVVVDAVMAKRNLGTRLEDASVVIGLGPGFTAGSDVHAVVETNRGHHLGRVIWQGSAEQDTGVPGSVGGYTVERLIRAPHAGRLRCNRTIGDRVETGEVVCWIDETPVPAAIPGVLRGMLHDGLPVFPGMKIGDVDPRAAREHCFSISDKALAVGGGVLEAALYLLRKRARGQTGVVDAERRSDDRDLP